MQNGVSITTKDSELNINYGMINIRPEREDARSSVRYILTDLNDIRKNYMYLGFHLRECLKMKYYEDFGYTTMEEFCENNFGLDKTAVSRCINVCEEFSMKEHFSGEIKHDAFKLALDDQWKDFSYSQLVEMLPLSEEQRYKIKPTMSIKEIREYKKSLKQKLKKTDDGEVATSQQVESLKISDINKLYGAALQSKIKKASGSTSEIIIYDKNGKLLGKCTCDLILESGFGNFYFRLQQSIEDLEKDKEKPVE